MADETINAEELQSQADAIVRNEIANKWAEKRDVLLAEKAPAVEETATESIPDADKVTTPQIKAEAEKELSKLSENQLKQWSDKLTNLYKTETKKAGLTDEEAQAIINDAKSKGTTEGKYVDLATQGKQMIEKLQQQQDAFNKQIEMQKAITEAWANKQAEQVSQKVRKDMQKQAQADAIKAQADAFVKAHKRVSDNIKTAIKDNNPLKADFDISPQRVAKVQAERQMQDNVDAISKELDKPLEEEFTKAKEQTAKDDATLRANQGAFMPQMATGMLEGINEAKNLDIEKIAKASADAITKGKGYTEEQKQQVYQISLSKAYDKVKGKTTSNTEHIVRKTFLDNSVANLMKAGAAKASGNYYLNQASQERDAEYGAKHKFANVVGTVGSFVTDLGAMGASGVGGAVGSRVGGAIAGTLARNLVMRSGGKVALNTAMRMVTNKAIVPIAGAMAGGATNLGLWEGMSDATNQLATSKDYSFGQTLGAMGRGAILGTMTGGVGHLIGNITNKAVSAVSSTGAKVGAKVGGGLASWGAETTIFATPEMIADPEHAGDIWLDNGAMMAGFKAHSGVKSAGKFIDGVKKFKGDDLSASQLAYNNKPISQRVKEQFKSHPNECKFTPDEESEIRNGYSGLLNLDSGMSVEEYESLLGKFMNDKNVSASAKSRMSFILTGKRMIMPTILTTEIKEQDGKHVVIAYGLNDTIVMRKSFSDAKQAQKCLVETGEQAQINNVEILESDAKSKGGDVNAIRESVKEDTGKDIGKVLAKSFEQRTDEEHDAYADYMDKLAQVKPKEDKLELEPSKDDKGEEHPISESEVEQRTEEERTEEPSEEDDATHEREDDEQKVTTEEPTTEESSVTEKGETKSEEEHSEDIDKILKEGYDESFDERTEEAPSEDAVEDKRAEEAPIEEEPKQDAESDSEVRQKDELSGELSDKQDNPINEDGTLKSTTGNAHKDISSADKVSETADTAQGKGEENAEHLSEVATETAGEGRTLLDVDGKPIVVQHSDRSVELNYRTWKDGDKDKIFNILINDAGLDSEEATMIIANADAIADAMPYLMEKYPFFKLFQEKEATKQPIVRDTGEYISFDYSFDCIKKEAINSVLGTLVKEGKSGCLGQTQIEALKKILQKHGFLVPCVMCYVEAKRKILKQGKRDEQIWNAVREAAGLENKLMGEPTELTDAQKTILEEFANGQGLERVANFTTKDGEGIKADSIKKVAILMLNSDILRGNINYEWFMAPSAFSAFYGKFGNTGIIEYLSQGQFRGKQLLEATPFSIDAIPQSIYQKIYSRLELLERAGLRQFSYEDARAMMFFDYYTELVLLQGARAPMQLYTKRPFVPDMFGLTGVKINQSLIVDVWSGGKWHREALGLNEKEYNQWLKDNAGFIPKGGLPESDSRYVRNSIELVPAWSVESFPVDIAIKNSRNRDFCGNVGNVVVAPSVAFIRWAIDNPDIHMILPYHATGASPLMKKLTGYDLATPMDDGYHTLGKNGKMVSVLSVPKIGLYIKGGVLQFQALVRKNGGDARKAANVYLDYCRENGLTPMFNYEGVVDHKNYYKVLTDFRQYDEEGNIATQRAVKAKLPANWQELLEKYLEEEQANGTRVSNITLDDNIMSEIHAVTKYTSIEPEERESLLDLLGKIYGKDNVLVLSPKDFDAQLDLDSEQGRSQVLRDSGGIVYGYATSDRIVLNDGVFNANTPMHEHTHIWMKVVESVNPKLYARGMELWKGSPMWEDARQDLLKLGEDPTDQQIFSECISRFAGSENEKIIAKVTGVTDKKWLAKAMNWLQEFWTNIKSAFVKWTGLELASLTPEQFARMPIRSVYDPKERANYTKIVKKLQKTGVFETGAEMMYENLGEVQTANERFNFELTRYQNGEMGENEILHLGKPQGVMRLFLPNLPIVMRQRVIRKGTEKKHNVDVLAIRNMPMHLSSPLFVFQRSENTIGILTDMKDRNGKNVFVAIELKRQIQQGVEYLEVNDVRSFHGRDIKNIIEPIASNNTLKWVDKKKGLEYLSSASQPVQQEIDRQVLNSVTKLIDNFENPKEIKEFEEKNLQNLSEVATETAEALGMKVRFAYSDELKGRDAISKGWHDDGTDEMVIVLDNNVDADDIRETVYHEGVAHYGLRKMFGSEFDNFIQNVYEHTGTEIRNAIAEIGVRKGYAPMEATEEYLAKLAEDGKFKELNPSSWEKIKYFFKGMLSRFGLREISDNELRYSLWRSYQLRINGSKPTLMERAMDIAMQHRFKLGNYAPRSQRLYRSMDGGQIPKRKIAKEYDEQIGKSSYQAKEAFLDENASLDWYLRNASMLKYQEDVPGHINPYLGANRVGQVTKEDIEFFKRDFADPIHKEVRRLMDEMSGEREERYQKVTEYLMAKHGLERNNVMRQRATEERAREIYERAVDQLPTLDGKLKATAYDLQQNPNDPSCKTAYDNALLARDEAQQIIDEAQADWGAFVASHDVAEAKARQRLQDLQTTQINAMADVQQAQTKMQKSPNNKTYIKAYDRAVAKLKAIQDELNYATNDWDLFVLQYSDDYAGLTGLTKGEAEQSVPLDEATRRAIQIVKSFESNHKTDELWKKINKATHEILRKQYEGGMISEDKMNEIADTYQYYVPLRGFSDTTADEEYAYLQHGEGRQNVLKKAEGRSSMADDPIAYIEQMANDGIIRANDNALVKRTFLDFVQSHPTDLISATPIYIHRNPVSGKWEMADLPQIDPNDSADVVEEKMRKYVEQMENLIQTDSRNYRKVSEKVKIPYIIDKNKLKEHQIIAYRDGVPTLMTVNGNPRLAQAINNVRARTEGAVDSIVHTMKNLTRKVSMMYTGMNLDFIPSNFTRDSIFANTIVWIKESPKYALQFNKNYLSLGMKDGVFTTAQLFNRYRNGTLNMNNYIDKMFYEFMRNGAEVSYAEMASIEKTKKKVMRSIEGKKTLGETITKNVVAQTISDIARGVENRARFATYLTSREAGRDIARSVWDAREISVNFITRGARDKYFRKTGQTFVGNASGILSEVGNIGYAFFNASLQGSANFARAVNRNRAKGLAMCSGLFALGLATAWLGKQQDDDDDDNKYFDQPKHLRRQNMIVKSGKNWITVPLNTEYRAFFGFGEMVGSQLFNGDEVSASDVAMQFTQLAPVDVLEGSKAFIPTAIKPLAEASSNESWYGSPIWKETPYNELAPQYTKSYSSTPKYMVEWAEKLNTLSGGNKYRKGTLDWNPATIDYLLKQYGGSFYALPRQMYGAVKDIKGDKDFNWRDVPIANRFIKTGGDERRTNASLNEKFEDIRQKYEMVWYDFNNTRKDRLMDTDERYQHLEDMMQNEGDWLRLKGLMKGYDKLTTRRNQMSKAGNQEAVKAINERIQELKQIIVERVEEAESKK